MIIPPLNTVPRVHVTQIIGGGNGILGGAVGKLTKDNPVHIPEDPEMNKSEVNIQATSLIMMNVDGISPCQSVGIPGNQVTEQRDV